MGPKAELGSDLDLGLDLNRDVEWQFRQADRASCVCADVGPVELKDQV